MKILRLAIWFSMSIGTITTLSACNSTDATFGVDTNASPVLKGPDGPQVKPPSTLTGQETTNPQTLASTATIRMRFAPIIGAPVEKVTPLSRRISARAREQNVAIVASSDMTATHVIKGYFSVLGEGSNTTVIYVFDILDPSGNRLHRIQGQESVAGSDAANPWSVVPATTLESIADKAMAEFAVWQRGGQA